MANVLVTAGMIVKRLAELLAKDDVMVLVMPDAERIQLVLVAAVLVLVVLFPALAVKEDAKELVMVVVLVVKDALVVMAVVQELAKADAEVLALVVPEVVQTPVTNNVLLLV